MTPARTLTWRTRWSLALVPAQPALADVRPAVPALRPALEIGLATGADPVLIRALGLGVRLLPLLALLSRRRLGRTEAALLPLQRFAPVGVDLLDLVAGDAEALQVLDGQGLGRAADAFGQLPRGGDAVSTMSGGATLCSHRFLLGAGVHFYPNTKLKLINPRQKQTNSLV